MSKIQIMLAIVLGLAIVALFLPWVEILQVGAVDQSTTNYGYNYIVPGGALYAAPVGILCVIGFILSAYSFRARDRIGELNIIAGILIVVGTIAAFAYTASAAMSELGGAGGFGFVGVGESYGIVLEFLFGVLMIIFGALAKPNTAAMLRRPFKDFRWGVLPVPGRLLAVVFFVFLFIVPLTTDSGYTMRLMTMAALYTMFAVSWDLLSGYTGQVNFGHALFFGAGAYGSALLFKNLGWQPAVTIPLGALIATGIGVATCFPALRLRPPYLSLITLAFPIILGRIIRSLPKDIAGGNNGIRGLPDLANSPINAYYICLIVMTIAVLIMWKLTDAGSKYVRTGLIFHAIREDEIAARATGINTIRYKILAFAVGGFFAGLAGAMFAHYETFASPGFFSPLTSFLAIIWVVFGGIASIYGPVAGVYTLHVLLDYLRLTPLYAYRMLILSVTVILILLFMPEGVTVWIRDKIERECPRCKLTNAAWRRECRACSTSLR